MGSIYKRTRKRPIPQNAEIVTKRGKELVEWTGKNGRRHKAPLTEDGSYILAESRMYYIQYFDANGLKKNENTKTTEVDTARQILKAREKRAAEIRSGIIDPAAERIREAATVDMAEHIEKFAQSLTDKGRSPKHIDMTKRHVTQAIEALGWDLVNKMRSEDAQEYISGLKENQKKPLPLSARTQNAHLQSLKAFSGWLYKTKRASTHELRSLTTFAKDEGRHQRRVLSNEEMTRLLNAAADGPHVQCVPGQTRAILYLLASVTGYRRKELANLTPESFDLDGQTPTVNLGATSTKNNKAAVQPIPPQVADVMRGFLQGIEAGQAVFPLKRSGGGIRRTSKMMQVDLELARAQWIEEANSDTKEIKERTKSDFLKYENSQGEVADLHSLRHRYVTELARAGVPITLARDLARHSDIRLTAGIYSHVNLSEKAAAVNGIAFDAEPKGQQKGSTEGSTFREVAAQRAAVNRPLGGGNRQCLTQVDGRKGPGNEPGKPYKTGVKAQKKPVVGTTGVSSSAGTRTPDTRIMIPHPKNRKPFLIKYLGECKMLVAP
jgi:integrase